MSAAPKNTRKNIRFQPDVGTYARLDFRVNAKTFKPTLIALVTEESFSGCGIVITYPSLLEVGALCRIRVGNLKPMLAEVRWRKVLDPKVVRIGLKYID